MADKHVASKDALICDFGCGRGICGKYLAKAGYTNLFGIDGSKGMLDVLRDLKIYKEVWQCMIGLDPFLDGHKEKYDDKRKVLKRKSSPYIHLHHGGVFF